MVDKLQIIHVTALIIQTYYDKLRSLSIDNLENDPEYDKTVFKLIKCVEGESTLYQELSDKDINSGLNYFNQNGIHSWIEERISSRLKEQKQIRDNPNNQNELGRVISSKIMIDVLKKVTSKILSLTDEGITDEEIDSLLLYNDVHKYHYLTTNSYIESLALSSRFCILALPSLDFHDIEEKYNVSFIEPSTSLAYDYIKASLDELINIKTEDEYFNVYLSLFETTRIEVMLPYLNKEYLNKLSNHLDTLNMSNNLSVRKIKRLIRKQKEELE